MTKIEFDTKKNTVGKISELCDLQAEYIESLENELILLRGLKVNNDVDRCVAKDIGCKCSAEEFSHPDLCLSHYVAFEIWIANGGHEVYESQTLTQEEKREVFREALNLLSPDDTAEIIERKFANKGSTNGNQCCSC